MTTTNTPTTTQTNDDTTQLEQQLQRAHQTAELGERLFTHAQTKAPVPGLQQQGRTSFTFRNGWGIRAKTTVEAISPDEVSISTRRITSAQAEAVLDALLPKRPTAMNMDSPTNAARIQWAEDVANNYARAHWGGETFCSVGAAERSFVLSDLVNNLMHLADAEGIAWNEIINRATMHFDAEVDEEQDSDTSNDVNA